MSDIGGAIRARMSLAMRLRETRFSVDLKKVALIVREYYPEVASRRIKETDKYPRGFWSLVLENSPHRIYEDVEALVKAIKKSVLEGTLEPYEGLKILKLEEDIEKDLGASLLAVSGHKLEEIIDKIPKLKVVSRIKARLHSVSRIKPRITPEIARLCAPKEFFDEALEMFAEGYEKEALETLINTFRGTNDVSGLKAVVSRTKDPEIILKAFSTIITDVSGILEFLDSMGRSIEDLIRYRISIGRPPEAPRVKEFLREHREVVRRIVKEERGCPRYRILEAEKFDASTIEEALMIPYKAVGCPAKVAVKCVMRTDERLLSKIIDHYGCVALREAVREYGIRKSFLALSRTMCPSIAPDIIATLTPEHLKDPEILERAKEIRKLVSPHHVARLAKLLVEAYEGSGDEEIVDLVTAMSSKSGLEEELPVLLARIYGKVTEDMRDRFEKFNARCLLKLISLNLVTSEVALKILYKAIEEKLYIPLSVLIEASKLGVPDRELEKIAEMLPIHTTISFRGRLGIKNKDGSLRAEFIEKATNYGLDIPNTLLEELAEAYSRDQEYISFLYMILRRTESKRLAEFVAEKMRGLADRKLLDRLEQLYLKRRPCPEAIKAIGLIFEGSKNEEAVERIRKFSLELLPIEAIEALIAMRRVHKDVVNEPRFYERFTPTLARASLSPGGYGAFGILTAIYEGCE